MADGIRTDHDPPKPRHLDDEGRDTRPLRKIKPRPGDHPDRQWQPEHLEAGYHLQRWRRARPDHDCLGLYTFAGGVFRVAYLERGHTHAPEYEIRFLFGPTLTVLDHLVVADYVAMHDAHKVRR